MGARVKLLSCDTSRPSPQPMITSGPASHRPESARGTIGMRIAVPTASSTKPIRMMLAGRRPPARRPASNATANMLRDSGARDRPACSALYSRTICRKIGKAIIAPPSEICWSICPLIPRRKLADRKRSGSMSVSCPARLRRTSHQASDPSPTTPTARSTPMASPPSCQARMPSTMPPMPSTEKRAPTRSMPRGPV